MRKGVSFITIIPFHCFSSYFSRQTSATVRPFSSAFNIPKTCVSLNLVRFIPGLLGHLTTSRDLHFIPALFYGEFTSKLTYGPAHV